MPIDPRLLASSGWEVFTGNELIIKGILETEGGVGLFTGYLTGQAFYDHVRIERMLFDGVLDPVEGELRPDLSRPGLGLELTRPDADRVEVSRLSG